MRLTMIPTTPFLKRRGLGHTMIDLVFTKRIPLAVQARKRLNLLLSQKFTWMLVVDKRDQIFLARKVPYTNGQLKSCKDLAIKLYAYKGKTIDNDNLNLTPRDNPILTPSRIC